MDRIKRNNLLNCCLNGQRNIFDEIRKSRKCRPSFATSIDNVTEDIPLHFAEIYDNLYNSVEDQESMKQVEENVKADIDFNSFSHIDRITKKVLVDASRKLKPGKSDPMLDITSDCLINGPNILFDRLSIILKAYLMHGHISNFLLISTVLPIIKDKFGDT